MRLLFLGRLVALVALSSTMALAEAPASTGHGGPAPSTIARSGRVAGDPVINVPGSIRGVEYRSLTGGKPITPQVLFGRDLRPEGRDSHQGRYDDPTGHAGNCYLMATTAAYAEFHPKVITSIFLAKDGTIRTSASGKPSARFFEKERATGDFKPADGAIYDGRAPVRVAADEMAFGKLVNGEKVWSQMMEYTFTKFRNQQGGAVRSDDPNVDRTGFNRTANGGYPSHVMQALTGKPAVTIPVDPKHEDEIWAKLVDAQRQNKVVVVGTVGAAWLKDRVKTEIEDGRRDRRSLRMGFDEKRWVDGHAYAAWGDKDHPFVFEKDGVRMIRLRNPWGVNPPGGRGENGIGEVTFKEFVTRVDAAYIGEPDAKE